MQAKYIRLNKVIHLTGLGRSSIYKFMAEGSFPKSISFGAKRIAWLESDIQNWMQQKIESRKPLHFKMTNWYK